MGYIFLLTYHKINKINTSYWEKLYANKLTSISPSVNWKQALILTLSQKVCEHERNRGLWYSFKIIKMEIIILSMQGCYKIRDTIMSTKKVFNKS